MQVSAQSSKRSVVIPVLQYRKASLETLPEVRPVNIWPAVETQQCPSLGFIQPFTCRPDDRELSL